MDTDRKHAVGPGDTACLAPSHTGSVRVNQGRRKHKKNRRKGRL